MKPANSCHIPVPPSTIPPPHLDELTVRFAYLATSNYTDQELSKAAVDAAHACATWRNPAPWDGAAYTDKQIIDYTKQILSGLPIAGKTASQQVDQLCKSGWWRRRLRIHYGQAREMAEIRAGRVGGRSGRKYVSDFATARRAEAEERARKYMEASYIESSEKTGEDGEPLRVPLVELNEKREYARQAELLAITRGIQQLAEDAGLEQAIATFTLDGPWHSNPNCSTRVSKWNGASPQAAHRELMRQMADFRALLHKIGITPSGIRDAEPHDDATPHTHMSIAYPPSMRGEMLAAMIIASGGEARLSTEDAKGNKHEVWFDTKDDALAGTGRAAKQSNEKARCDLAVVNTARRTNVAVNYITKYVTKLQSPSEVILRKARARLKELEDMEPELVKAEQDPNLTQWIKRQHANRQRLAAEIQTLEEKHKKEAPTLLRYRTWTGVWQIRRFAFVGIRETLGVWREFRRMKKQQVQDGLMRALWNTVIANDFAAFLRFLGGLPSAPVPAICKVELVKEPNTTGKGKKTVGIKITDLQSGRVAETQTRTITWKLITDWTGALRRKQEEKAAEAAAARQIQQTQVVDLIGNVVPFNSLVTVILNSPSKESRGLSPPGISPVESKSKKKPGGRYKSTIKTRYKT